LISKVSKRRFGKRPLDSAARELDRIRSRKRNAAEDDRYALERAALLAQGMQCTYVIGAVARGKRKYRSGTPDAE
jgi:hypothetical protein